MTAENQTRQVDIAKELADKWYMENRYTDNGRWQECRDYADKIVSQLLAQAETRGRVDELKKALTNSNKQDIAGQHKWYLEDRLAELEASLKERKEG